MGEPEPMRPEPYPPFTPETTPSGDILFATRTVDPVAAAAEARRSGSWASTAITDSLWPAKDARTRPLMPLRRGHMAMLVVVGFLDNHLPIPNGRTELVQRLVADTCELYGSTDKVQVYHIRAMKDLRRKGRAKPPVWIEVMAQRRRRRFVVCALCHPDIHSGRPLKQNVQAA